MQIRRRLLMLTAVHAIAYVCATMTHSLAGQAQLTWQDPNNNSAAIGGYNLYYWQTSWTTPARVNVGKQLSYTLTGVEDGKTYHFAVTAYDLTGSLESAYSNEVTKTISIAAPVANFTANTTTGLIPLTIGFTSTSTGSITSWAWTFGDGGTSTAQNPSHTYTTAGTYTVKLTVTGSGGSNTVTKTGYITASLSSSGSGTGGSTGLVAAYNFDAGSGSTLVDISGNNRNGAISGATWVTTGKFGKALSFDGVNDWVTIADTSALDLTTDMTLEAWVYPTATPTTWSTVLLKEQPGALVYALYAGSPANRPSVQFNVGTSSSGERILSGPAALPLNTWSHLAGTYDGITLRLYINGVLKSSQVATGIIRTSSNPLRIGGNGVWGEFFKGRIDDVRIYNRALTASAIQTDMNTPVGSRVMQLAVREPEDITLEAEAMTLIGYQIERNADASGGQLISRQQVSRASLGRATAPFPGPAGIYDVIVTYLAENAGQSTFKFFVDGEMLDTWGADDALPARVPNATTLAHRVVAQRLSLAPDQSIQLRGREQPGGHARIDKIDFVPARNVGEIVVDNNSVNTSQTGTWKVARSANSWTGQSLYSATNPATFRWMPSLPVNGSYQVYAWWTPGASCSTEVPYRIHHKSSTTVVTVNQQDTALDGQWHLLGTFRFDAGNRGYVEVSSENGQASADAVRFVKQ